MNFSLPDGRTSFLFPSRTHCVFDNQGGKERRRRREEAVPGFITESGREKRGRGGGGGGRWKFGKSGGVRGTSRQWQYNTFTTTVFLSFLFFSFREFLFVAPWSVEKYAQRRKYPPFLFLFFLLLFFGKNVLLASTSEKRKKTGLVILRKNSRLRKGAIFVLPPKKRSLRPLVSANFSKRGRRETKEKDHPTHFHFANFENEKERKKRKKRLISDLLCPLFFPPSSLCPFPSLSLSGSECTCTYNQRWAAMQWAGRERENQRRTERREQVLKKSPTFSFAKV